jgi:exodeoxyribonuclease-3
MTNTHKEERELNNVVAAKKVIGWNINQRSGLGKAIPELVVQELLDQNADVIVITEVFKYQSL